METSKKEDTYFGLTLEQVKSKLESYTDEEIADIFKVIAEKEKEIKSRRRNWSAEEIAILKTPFEIVK